MTEAGGASWRAPPWCYWAGPVLTAALCVALSAASGVAASSEAPSSDAVLTWNDQVNRAIQFTAADPFMASRALALESIAVLDTVKSIAGEPAFLVRLPAPRDLPAGVAAAAAAHEVLSHLFPARQPDLDAALASSLDIEPSSPLRGQAVTFGKAVADAVIAIRDRDGWNAYAGTRAGISPGEWRPTPPNYLPAMHPQWATVVPFGMSRPDQFRPPGPPTPGTASFNEGMATVASLGGARSTVRTAEQTEVARYWSDAIGTYAPAGHWNAIAADIAGPLHLGLAAEAELLAELNVAIADAGIAMADAKYTYWSWRPVTAIRAGGHGTPPVAEWTPLLVTPNHPSYVSGHSSFSGAAAVVLTAWFGDRPFRFSSASLPGVTRAFTSFQQAAEEAAMSRMYGGIHFPSDNEDGLVTGRAVGAWTLGMFQRIANDRGPTLVIDGPAGARLDGPHGISGYALDNFSPVTAVTVMLDGDKRLRLAVDGSGRFAMPRRLAAPSRRHEVAVAARSVSGRVAIVRLETEAQATEDLVTAPVSVK